MLANVHTSIGRYYPLSQGTSYLIATCPFQRASTKCLATVAHVYLYTQYMIAVINLEHKGNVTCFIMEKKAWPGVTEAGHRRKR